MLSRFPSFATWKLNTLFAALFAFLCFLYYIRRVQSAG